MDKAWPLTLCGLTTRHVIDYPDTPPAYGPFHRLAYDSMGRLSGLKDFNNADMVNNVTYGPAGQLLTLSWMNYTETRQYNNLLQMTRLTAAGGSQGSLDLEYDARAPRDDHLRPGLCQIRRSHAEILRIFVAQRDTGVALPPAVA